MLVDAHCHPCEDEESMGILAQQPVAAVIMSTNFGDIDLVQKLSQSSQDIVAAYGFHPWFTHQVYLGAKKPDKAEHYKNILDSEPSKTDLAMLPEPRSFESHLAKIKEFLLNDPNAIVGECGLDKPARIKVNGKLTPYRTRLEHQAEILEKQLQIASDLKRPVSLHGVQCHAKLYEVVLKHSLPSICLHSYSGSSEMFTQQWAKLQTKVFVSISSLVNLRQAPQKLKSLLEAVPLSRVLTESDCSSAARVIELVELSLSCISEAHSISLQECEAIIERNYQEFLSED